MADSFKVTEQDMNNAKSGMMFNAHVFGVDLNDSQMKPFFDHITHVIAASQAESRFFSSCLNKATLGSD